MRSFIPSMRVFPFLGLVLLAASLPAATTAQAPDRVIPGTSPDDADPNGRTHHAVAAAVPGNSHPTVEERSTNVQGGSPHRMEGTIYWVDSLGGTHPVVHALVELFEWNVGGNTRMATTFTDQNGFYSAVISNTDDEGGDPDVWVRVHAYNTYLQTLNADGDSYHADGPIDLDRTEEVIVYNLTVTGASFSVFQAATWAARYVDLRNGSFSMPYLDVIWPHDDSDHPMGSFYDDELYILDGHAHDWDTVQHEYGHFVQDVFDLEENPGGEHTYGDCLSAIHGKGAGIRFAWGEGWPTFFALNLQREMNLADLGIPRVGDTEYKSGAQTGRNIEISDPAARGEDNEFAVVRFLWDLVDTGLEGNNAPEPWDTLSLPDQFVWNTIITDHSVTLSQAWIALWHAVDPEVRLAMGNIGSRHGLGPAVLSPDAGTLLNPGDGLFSWNRGVECDPAYQGSTFELIFYSHLDFEPVLTLPMDSQQHALTPAQFQFLLDNNHNAIVGVKAYSEAAPLTGPYLGQNHLVILNTPPVAHAGQDLTVECAGPGGTAVSLDATGSSDADGDLLTVVWTAPGVDWDDRTSKTPIGVFPNGTTTVTLEVDDGYQEDTDEVQVTVVDTTPPSISCPDAATVECTSHCGTAAEDDLLDAFFLGVEASDICDPEPAVTDNAPVCFPLGTTEVVFMATDAHGNAAACTTSVTVEDTTPPEIVVLLDRDVLWPADHKFVPIAAEVTVTDICDPAPTFVLTSITSNEDANGAGDGSTSPDVRGAETGTADTAFALRAERSGKGTGRVYTITYVATDASGNSAQAVVTVDVPHDQPGSVVALQGLARGVLDPREKFLVLAIPSAEGPEDGIVDTDRLYLGNGGGILRPTHVRRQDVDFDGVRDVVALFDREDLEGRAPAFRRAPVGFHYTADNVHYLVPDIRDISPYVGSTTPTSIEPLAPGVRLVAAGGSTRWELSLPDAGRVRVDVFSVLGRRVRVLADAVLSAGSHAIAWDGTLESGNPAPAGIYLYRFQVEGRQFLRKAPLVR